MAIEIAILRGFWHTEADEAFEFVDWIGGGLVVAAAGDAGGAAAAGFVDADLFCGGAEDFGGA